MFSTKWRRPSSRFTGHWVLALGLPPMLALQNARSQRSSAVAPRTPQSVGQRLAADLTWPQVQRDQRFAHMDRLFPTHTVWRSGPVRPLPATSALPLPANVLESYLRTEHLAGVLVLQDGRIRAERYALGASRQTRWTTFSVTKSVTDTLAGAALQSRALRSLDDDVILYLPEMKDSAYDGVTVRQLMTMTSGVRWLEDYSTPDADNVRLYTTPAPAGQNSTVAYMRHLQREAAPGLRWHYNTGETDLLGVVLRRATGKTLANQLSQTIWRTAGMQSDATWIANTPGTAGVEFGGSGLSATLRDLGRYGLWVLDGGHGAVPSGWFAEATRVQVQAGGGGYGYGWWPQPNGSFAALGIFGQSVFIDPARKLVVVSVGNWPEATGKDHTAARAAFWQAVQAASSR